MFTLNYCPGDSKTDHIYRSYYQQQGSKRATEIPVCRDLSLHSYRLFSIEPSKLFYFNKYKKLLFIFKLNVYPYDYHNKYAIYASLRSIRYIIIAIGYTFKLKFNLLLSLTDSKIGL